MAVYRRRAAEVGRYEGDSPSDRGERRPLRPWPGHMHFTTSPAERILDQQMPPRPVPMLAAAPGRCASNPALPRASSTTASADDRDPETVGGARAVIDRLKRDLDTAEQSDLAEIERVAQT